MIFRLMAAMYYRILEIKPYEAGIQLPLLCVSQYTAIADTGEKPYTGKKQYYKWNDEDEAGYQLCLRERDSEK